MRQRTFDERRSAHVAGADDQDPRPFPLCHRVAFHSGGATAEPPRRMWRAGGAPPSRGGTARTVVLLPLSLEHSNDNDRPLTHNIHNALHDGSSQAPSGVRPS